MMRFTTAIKRWAPVRALVLALCLAVQWAGPVADAAIFDGHSGLNTNWSTPTNWVGNVVPTSGSPNLDVILGSTGTTTLLTSNQDLAAPFVLQQLSIGPFGSLTPHAVSGSPLSLSNLGDAPSIRSRDFLAPNLTINNDLIFNADVGISSPGLIPTIGQYSFNGAISGTGGLRHGGGHLFLGGTEANTYAGLTIVDSGVIHLTKPASVIAIPGDVFINIGSSTRNLRGSVIVGNDKQIAADATVTIDRGLLAIQGGDQTLANIKLIGVNFGQPHLDGGSVVISPSRTLTITGGITRTSPSIPPIFPFVSSLISGGTLNLNGGLRTFHVDDENPIGLPTTLTVSSVITNGGIQKTGAGVLHLFSAAKNTFTGNVLVNGGLFRVDQNVELLFDLKNGGVSNRILGTANAYLNGIFTIDPASVTDISSSWNLVEVANLNETFGPGFKLQFVNGTSFSDVGAGVYRSGRWKFNTADGNLTLSAVPEPAGLALAACGGLALGLHRPLRRRLTAFAVGA